MEILTLANLGEVYIDTFFWYCHCNFMVYNYIKIEQFRKNFEKR